MTSPGVCLQRATGRTGNPPGFRFDFDSLESADGAKVIASIRAALIPEGYVRIAGPEKATCSLALVDEVRARDATVRAGAGLFYSAVFSGITLTTTRFDGVHQRELRIEQPQFFGEIPATLDGSIAAQQTIYRKAPGLKAPYSFISHVSYERQLPWKMFGAISYSWQRGVNLLRVVAPRVRELVQLFRRERPALVYCSNGVVPSLPVVAAAALCGVPVICSDLPVLRELADGVATFCDPSSPTSFATGMSAVLESDDRDRIQRGIARAGNYTWKTAAEQTVTIYERVLAGRPRSLSDTD